ncbi:alpha-tocopherol transfer protein-like [Cydia strobilella]|uniref:alpha-tocopherol transfer protein-like n=1 Tax=Cydia strobilella TaxID=1100964 RepID=UPI003004F990
MAEITHINPLLLVTEKQIQGVRACCDLDVKQLRESIDAVLEWCSKEPHLEGAVPILKRIRLIERTLLITKGSIEETKKRIEAVLTSRGMMPELSHNRSVDEFKTILGCVNYLTLPKLCPSDNSRVILVNFNKENIDDFTLSAYFRYAFYVGEFRLFDDYTINERHVIDLEGVHLGVLTKINPILLKKAELLATEGYGTKIKGIHILNAPTWVDRFVFILKQCMKPKVAGRLHVHNSISDFQKHVPKEVLPKEYGGDEQSVRKLADAWNDFMSNEETKQRIKDLDQLVADESRRTNTKFNDEYLGMPGSFRKLTVD